MKTFVVWKLFVVRSSGVLVTVQPNEEQETLEGNLSCEMILLASDGVGFRRNIYLHFNST